MSAAPRSKEARAEAKRVFASHYARTRDSRAAARAAGVSERTGRRWRGELATLSAADRTDRAGPAELTSFVGREAAFERLESLFSGGARLVTLAGPPGIGKTRLAAKFLGAQPAAARTLAFCDVREAQTADDVCVELGRTLGIQLGDGDAEADLAHSVGRALRARGQCLVVLDNFEQLVPVAADVVHRWLRLAPELCLLITSRRILRLEGEHVYDLEPLCLPGSDRSWSNEAMRLFYERAVSVDPTLRKDEQTALYAAEVVRRVEGIPLAIELAAGQLRRLALGELLRRLDAPAIELGDDARDASPRHATLRHALEISWRLLSTVERDVLSQLTVFRDGFTSEAAEAVVVLGAGAGGATILDVLSRLREMSLLRVVTGDGAVERRRWGLYTSIWEYAVDQGADEDASGRHAAYFAAEGEQLALRLRGPGAPQARRALFSELSNLRSALSFATDTQDAALAARLGLVLHAGIGPSMPAVTREALDAVVALLEASDADSGVSCEALLARAEANRQLGQYASADADLDAVEELPWRKGKITARAAFERGVVAFKRGEVRRAKELYEKALRFAESEHLSDLQGRVHMMLAFVLAEAFADEAAFDHYDRALECLGPDGDPIAKTRTELFRCGHRTSFLRPVVFDEFQQHLERARQLGDAWLETNGLIGLGFFLQDRGDLHGARGCYREAADISAKSGLNYSHAAAELLETCALDEIGDATVSRAAYQTAVERYRGMGARRAEGIALTHLAGYVAREGEHQAAADLLDKADELLRDSGDVAFQSLVDIQRGQVEMACDRASAHLQDPNSDERPRRLAEARLLAASQAETFASRGGPRTLLSSSWGARLFSRLLRREIERRPSLCVWRGGRAFQVGDRSVMKLDQHPVSRRVLQALAEHRVQKPGHALPMERLLALGWPGEKIIPAARKVRVRNVIHRLRRAGLRDVLRQTEGGYAIDVGCSVQFVDDEILNYA